MFVAPPMPGNGPWSRSACSITPSMYICLFTLSLVWWCAFACSDQPLKMESIKFNSSAEVDEVRNYQF